MSLMKLLAKISSRFFYYMKMEFCLVRFDHLNKRVQLLLKAYELFPHLVQLNEGISNG